MRLEWALRRWIRIELVYLDLKNPSWAKGVPESYEQPGVVKGPQLTPFYCGRSILDLVILYNDLILSFTRFGKMTALTTRKWGIHTSEASQAYSLFCN